MTASDYIMALPAWAKFQAKRDGEVRRCLKEADGAIFVFGKKKRRYGRRFHEVEDFLAEYKPVMKDAKDEDTKWHSKVSRLRKKMEASGLWPELLEKVKNLEKMDLEDRQNIKFWYDRRYGRGSLESLEEAYRENTRELKLMWESLYPFLFIKDDNGEDTIDTFYLWEMSECQTKTIYFGKYHNKEYKARIKEAIEKKEEIRLSSEAGYDVSFSYDPNLSKAWYSEEYRGCGNGHYYIAIDENTAWFVEND